MPESAGGPCSATKKWRIPFGGCVGQNKNKRGFVFAAVAIGAIVMGLLVAWVSRNAKRVRTKKRDAANGALLAFDPAAVAKHKNKNKNKTKTPIKGKKGFWRWGKERRAKADSAGTVNTSDTKVLTLSTPPLSSTTNGSVASKFMADFERGEPLPSSGDQRRDETNPYVSLSPGRLARRLDAADSRASDPFGGSIATERIVDEYRATIFVIVTARKNEARVTAHFVGATLSSCTCPGRVRFGVVLTESLGGVDAADEEDAFWEMMGHSGLNSQLRGNVRVMVYPQSRNCSDVMAIHQAENSLYRGEEFVCYCENWVAFSQGWDCDCESQWRRLHDKNGVITHPCSSGIGSGSTGNADGALARSRGKKQPCPFYRFARFNSRGLPMFDIVDSHHGCDKSFPAVHRSREFCFGPATSLSIAGHPVEWCSTDERDWPWGMTVQLVTQSFALYVPPWAIVTRRRWSQNSSYSCPLAHVTKNYKHLWNFVGTKPTDGATRVDLFDEVARATGVDTWRRTAHMRARLGFAQRTGAKPDAIDFTVDEVRIKYGTWASLHAAKVKQTTATTTITSTKTQQADTKEQKQDQSLLSQPLVKSQAQIRGATGTTETGFYDDEYGDFEDKDNDMFL